MDLASGAVTENEGAGSGANPVFDFDAGNIIFAYNGSAYASSLTADRTVRYIFLAPAGDSWPAVAPAGDRIIFGSMRNGVSLYDFTAEPPYPPFDIYQMDPDGGNIAKITGQSLSENFLKLSSEDSMPYLSPDSSKITFTSARDGNQEIYAMSATGGDGAPVRLTSNNLPDYSSSYSPEGTKIIFVSERDGNPEVYMMNADGSGHKNISNNAAGDYAPRISPDGKRIVFVSERFGRDNPDICIMNADGSGFARLSNNPAYDGMPSFSPDGSKIVYYSEENGAGIYTMNIDGTALTMLTYLNYNPGQLTSDMLTGPPFWWGK